MGGPPEVCRAVRAVLCAPCFCGVPREGRIIAACTLSMAIRRKPRHPAHKLRISIVYLTKLLPRILHARPRPRAGSQTSHGAPPSDSRASTIHGTTAPKRRPTARLSGVPGRALPLLLRARAARRTRVGPDARRAWKSAGCRSRRGGHALG